MNLKTPRSTASQRPRRQRNQLNKRMQRMGRVIFSEGGNPVHCIVNKFTESSATLSMTGWMGLPSEFTLYIEPDSIRTECRVILRRGSNIEVEFLDVEHDVRYKQSA